MLNPRNIPLKSKVNVRLNNGDLVDGVLIDHSDWLVGCPVVETVGGEKIGIGYDGEIVSVVNSQEPTK